MTLPTVDGELQAYSAVVPENSTPRIYYVNGIQTTAATHVATATALSVLTEHVVYGIYNASAGQNAGGMILDLIQCGADWTDVFLSKVAEIGNLGVNRVVNGLRDFFNGRLGRPQTDPINVADMIRQ